MLEQGPHRDTRSRHWPLPRHSLQPRNRPRQSTTVVIKSDGSNTPHPPSHHRLQQWCRHHHHHHRRRRTWRPPGTPPARAVWLACCPSVSARPSASWRTVWAPISCTRCPRTTSTPNNRSSGPRTTPPAATVSPVTRTCRGEWTRPPCNDHSHTLRRRLVHHPHSLTQRLL